jgi:tetratricopeptide (TPR) repeat protein
LRSFTSGFIAVAFSCDSQLLASASGSGDNTVRLWILHNNAWFAQARGIYKIAETMAQEAASTREDILDLEDVATIASMGLLASTFWNQGRWKEAEELEVQVMETRKRVLGEEHPDTLTSMANLASTYRNQGRWKEAEELDVQVMETRKRVLDEEHPDTLTSMANLASTYRNQGRWKEADSPRGLSIKVIIIKYILYIKIS